MVVGNDMFVSTRTKISLKVLEEGRVQGFSICEVRKGIELNDVEALPRLEPIIRTRAGQLKVPINEGYMPTPTFSVVG